LDRLNLSLSQVIASIQKSDREYAIGFIINSGSHYLLKSNGKRDRVDARLKSIPITARYKIERCCRYILWTLSEPALHILVCKE